MSSTNLNAQSPPISSTAELDSTVEALVDQLVRSRLQDTERQIEAWKRQEAEMQKHHTSLLQTIEELNYKLATAESQVTEAQQIHQPLIPSAAPAATNVDPTEFPPRAVPRKRRRQTASPVPDTAPALNTRRRSRQNTLATTPPTPALNTRSRQPILGAIPPIRIPPRVPVRSTNAPVLSQFTFNPLDTTQQAPTQPPLDTIQQATTRPPEVPPKSRKKKAVVKTAAQIYRFLPQEMPNDIGGLKKAMALHLRMLWALLDAKEIPQDPPAQLLNGFFSRFPTEAELLASRDSGPELIPLHLVRVGTAMSAAQGHIANQARLVEEHMLRYIQACLSRFGLDRWCPDLRQSAYSVYNSACRIIALDTFKQALVSHAYIHLNPNTAYATDMTLLIRFYDHFVFHFIFLRYRKDSRSPGSVMQELQMTPQYQGRIRLAAARLKFLVENNYPQRYRDLIDPKATSDDEYDRSDKKYHIKRRPERSSKAVEFLRVLDYKREESARNNKSQRWKERVRVVPTEQQDSLFRVLPEGMPVDYFDPIFFNQLQPKTRNRIAMAKVSLLPSMSQALTWNVEERMTDKAFTKKYGAEVFSQYEMVSDIDMEADADDEWAEDEDEEDEDMPLTIVADDADIASSRQTISLHLSDSGGSSMSSVS